MAKKKLLIVSTVRFAFNGITNVILSHVESLRESNLDITVVQWGKDENKNNNILDREGIKQVVVPNRRGHTLKYYFAIKKLLKKEKFDYIHIHGNSGTMAIEVLLAKRFNMGKIIVHAHSMSCSHNCLYGPNSIFMKFVKKHSNILVACSSASGNWLYKNNYICIPNAIDLKKFRFNINDRELVRKRYDIPESCYVIGYVAGFNSIKNHKFLIDLFKEYLKINLNTKLLLVGDGQMLNEIKSYSESLCVNNKIIFAGAQSDTWTFYSAFDIFVFPSLSEGLGLVAIEAQANGIPVLASKNIPMDIKCSDYVFFKDLNDGELSWAQEIEKIRKNNYSRYNAYEELTKSGFNLSELGKKLIELYNM